MDTPKSAFRLRTGIRKLFFGGSLPILILFFILIFFLFSENHSNINFFIFGESFPVLSRKADFGVSI